MRAVLGSARRRWAALGVAIVIVTSGVVAFWPRTAQVAVTSEELTVPGAKAPWDRAPVQLDATLYLPARTPAPAVIMAHGFGGSKTSVASDAQDLARSGFVVLAYSARGFGKSTGSISLDSLDAEVPDARRLIDYLATRPEVQLDAPGDPRVGVTGASYGGALSLMLAGTDRRIDATVPLITWNSLEKSLFPNALQPKDSSSPGTPAPVAGSGDGVFKKYWAASLISSVVAGADLSPSSQVDLGPIGGGVGGRRDGGNSASTSDAQPVPAAGSLTAAGSTAVPAGCGRLRLEVCSAYAGAADTGRISPAMHSLLARSSPSAVVGKITAPTLLVQGEQDTLFPLDEADANARALAAAGTTVAVDWYRGGHDGGSPDPATRARITGWLQYYLTGTGSAPSTAFRYSVDGGLTDSGRPRTRTLQTSAYPGIAGAPAVPRQQISVSGGKQVILNPPGGSPAAISSLPGLARAGALTSLVSVGLPGQSASYVSQPFDQLTVITGSAEVSVSVSGLPTIATKTAGNDRPTSGAVLFASIGARTAGGLLTMGGGAVAPIRLPALPADGTASTVTVDLPAVSLQVAAGDRLIVRFTTTDQAYSGPTSPAAYLISGVESVSVPVAGGVMVSAGEVPIGVLIALILVAVIAVIGLVLAGGRRRPRQPASTGTPGRWTIEGPGERVGDAPAPAVGADPDAVVAPLVIEHLSKSYPGGVKAVQDVSFEVRTGQVLGLLGPNGAGKTTTLRMVMGLIRPTGGQIRVFGQPVSAGAEILARVGSFVEGSGFLPHLSGRVNLALYWRATGRPLRDAHMDDVLNIAGLGPAVDRRVKTFSQGMRQRLAIAQAMLGLPDLLLLDEPTNGLDPPQIHAMREVLRRYAGTGRTVLVSSHLLSEVEQTCGDVVVIHHGRTIASGRVADLIATSGEMTFTVDDPEAAARLLSRIEGIGDIEVVDGAVQADLGGVRAAAAVTALVAADIAVSAAAPRNRLEDVFLDLVGATGGGRTGGTS